MSEKKVRKKRKKKRGRKRVRNKDKGRPVRLSNAVLHELEDRKDGLKESFDSVIRKILGLKNRKGEKPKRDIFWVLPKALKVRKTEAEARGDAVMDALERGKRSPEKPVRVVRDE